MGLDYEIAYKRGTDNRVADALSRLHETEAAGSVHEITTLQPNWLSSISESYKDDAEAKRIIQGIAGQETSFSHFQFSKGVIRSGDRIYVGKTGPMRQTIL